MSIQATVSNHAMNLIGKLSFEAIQMLQWAGYSVVRQEGDRGYITGSYTVPLDKDLTYQGVVGILANQKIIVRITAAA